MRFYELMFVSDPSNDEGAETIKQKIEGIITDHEGSISSFDKLGKKRLAYPIAKRQYGIYNLVNFQGNATVVDPLETFLRLDSQVFRHIILVFSEKILKLRTETKKIQVEEDERMRRGGRPTHELTDLEKEKISGQTISEDPIILESLMDSEEAVVLDVKETLSILTEDASNDNSSEPVTSENDEKPAAEVSETSTRTDEDSSSKETAE